MKGFTCVVGLVLGLLLSSACEAQQARKTRARRSANSGLTRSQLQERAFAQAMGIPTNTPASANVAANRNALTPSPGVRSGYPLSQRVAGGVSMPGFGVVGRGLSYQTFGGTAMPGFGVSPNALNYPVAYGGTAVPGYGVIGGRLTNGVPVYGGMSIPGYGVVGPGLSTKVHGGTSVPGFGVIGGGIPGVRR